MSHSYWNLLSPFPEGYLAGVPDLPRLVAQLLHNRGIADPIQLELFLTPDKRLSNDPFLLPDMSTAVARIYRALFSGEKIAVYGDFDVDGVTSTALLVQGLSSLGAEAIPYIPHRFTEGYGLKTTGLENLYHQGVSLVITVDCGITALSEVKKAKRMGLDIIITDHHDPLSEIPSALAVVNPKLPGSKYPYSQLTGAGVAFKLIQALFQGMGRENRLDELMDLVALGTVADMAPLLAENRYLVKEGLKLINAAPRLGIKEMANQVGLNIGQLDTESISWVIAPRLNAAGRMAHAMTSYNLLMTDSPQEARELSMWLESKNAERQRLTSRFLAKAREQVLAQEISLLLIVCGEDYPAGLAGLVASRLSGEFYRPAVVIKTGEQVSSGSCRSIPEFNIIFALNQCSELFSHFGGHPQAAGFTLPTKNVSRLKQYLSQLAATQLTGVDLRPRLDIDTEVNLADLNGDTFQAICQLAPFGKGNPYPTFLSRLVEVIDCSTIGNNGGHLRFRLRQGGTVWPGVGFGLGNRHTEVSASLDIVYNLQIDRWGGEEKLRLNILDFAQGK